MATQTIVTKQHDTKITFTHDPTINDIPVLLSETTGCSVSFLIKSDTKAVKQTAVIQANPDVPLQAQFKYDPIATDVDTEGKYKNEWELIYPPGPPTGKILTFPNNGYNVVKILSDLG